MTIVPAGPLRVDYRVTNRGDLPLPYLWAAHPLIAIQPGDEICLPIGNRMSSTGSVNLKLADGAFSHSWPTLQLADGDSIGLSRVPRPEADFAVKLFVEASTAAIADRAHEERLEIAWSEPLAHCGLWLNDRGWSGAGTQPYFNLGVEPTTSAGDDLALLRHTGSARCLSAGETHAWSLTVGLCQMGTDRGVSRACDAPPGPWGSRG